MSPFSGIYELHPDEMSKTIIIICLILFILFFSVFGGGLLSLGRFIDYNVPTKAEVVWSPLSPSRKGAILQVKRSLNSGIAPLEQARARPNHLPLGRSDLRERSCLGLLLAVNRPIPLLSPAAAVFLPL